MRAVLQQVSRLSAAAASVLALSTGWTNECSASEPNQKVVIRLPAQSSTPQPVKAAPTTNEQPTLSASEHERPTFEERFNAAAAKLRDEVGRLVKNGQYDEARDILWKSSTGKDREVARRLAPFRDKLLREYVNCVQFIITTNELAHSTTLSIEKGDFVGARERLFGIRPVRVYPGEIEEELDDIRTELARTGVPADEAQKIVDVARPMLEEAFSDQVLQNDRNPPGVEFKPDESSFRDRLGALGRTLAAQGVSAATRDKVKRAIDANATPALRTLWRPYEEQVVCPPKAIGTSMLNVLIKNCRDDLYANRVVPAWIAARTRDLRARVESLVGSGMPEQARDAIRRFGKTGFPEVDGPVSAVKNNLYRDTVVPAWIALRTRELRAQVVPLVESGDLEQAREAIHAFGVVGLSEVDAPVLAVKLGLLNARINVAEWKNRSETLVALVDKALAVEDFEAASVAIDACAPVPAYGSAVDDELRNAAQRAVSMGADATRAGQAVEAARRRLDERAAERSGERGDAQFLEAYRAEVAGASGALPAESVDWSEVRASLEKAVQRLVDDDYPAREARAVTDEMMAAFRDVDPDSTDVLTTDELNRRLANLKADLFKKVANAEALAKAGRAASLVDFEARIGAFTKAAGDPREPDLRLLLAEGARILRLHRSGSPVSKEDATSLLAAAAFMGFDDVMELALALNANMDGHSAKDSLARPVLLLAVQGGFRGRSADILARAKRAAVDARGEGALHYAVRAENRAAVLDFLRAGVDAKRAGADKATPLILAADLGYGAIVKALIPFSDLAASDAEGYTALLRAANRGHADIARTLADAGAELNVRTKDGDGILELSARANAPALLDWLLDDLHFVPTKRVVVQLVRAGNVPTLQRMGSLHGKIDDNEFASVVKRGDLPMVKYLVEQGLDVNTAALRDIPISEPVADYLREQGWLSRSEKPTGQLR